MKGEVPTMETIVFSKGIVNLQQGSTYFVIATGLQVGFPPSFSVFAQVLIRVNFS